jgi:AcrR family transcriptional regulator
MSTDPRARIIDAAARLLADGGRDSVSTRAVGAAAGVQAPTIYRLFGDKRGLLDAVAEQGYARYVAEKLARLPSEDPVDDLRRGWDLHVDFALANPALYVLMTEPRPEGRPPVANQGVAYLEGLMRRIAEAGRLAVPEGLAFQLFGAAGQGATMLLLGQPEDERDLTLSVAAREAVIAAITTEAPVAGPGPAGAAIALRAAVPGLGVLSDAEKVLLSEWLDRIAAHPSG